MALKKCPRRMDSSAGELYASGFPCHCTDTGFDRGDEDSGEASPHGTECSPDHRATRAEAGVSVQVRADIVHEVNRFRESSAQNHSALIAVQTRLQVLEWQHP